jgi:hypothetical protein
MADNILVWDKLIVGDLPGKDMGTQADAPAAAGRCCSTAPHADVKLSIAFLVG